jgi:hypothetical protein
MQSLARPLLSINTDINLVKEENEIMKDLLSEYIVIFGAKTLKQEGREIEKPYEYIQKENIMLHNILLTLIGRLNMTKDDMGHIRDQVQKTDLTVKELDKFEHSLSEKKKIFNSNNPA